MPEGPPANMAGGPALAIIAGTPMDIPRLIMEVSVPSGSGPNEVGSCRAGGIRPRALSWGSGRQGRRVAQGKTIFIQKFVKRFCQDMKGREAVGKMASCETEDHLCLPSPHEGHIPFLSIHER